VRLALRIFPPAEGGSEGRKPVTNRVGDNVKTFRWWRWWKGKISAVHDDGTVSIEWDGGGVSVNATVVNGIVPRRY
jgi:hypothetical protein